SEIVSVENSQWDEVKELTLWQDDSWFNNWISQEPKLAGQDLRPYFYFARESLAYQMNVSLKLSKVASDILEGLLNKSDISRRQALKKSEQVSEAEASLILEKLKEK